MPFHEVDAHNCVPCWVTSQKREYGARTIRPKIHKHLPEYLQVRPPIQNDKWPNTQCHHDDTQC